MFSIRSRFCILLAVAFALLALVAPQVIAQQQPPTDWQAAQAALRADQTARAQLALEIMTAREAASGRTFDAKWAANQVEALANLSLAELEVLSADPLAPLPTKTFGSSTRDLIFTPLDSPCRFLDTRNTAGGALSAGATIPLTVAGGIGTSQGASTNCGVPFGPAVAIVANILAVTPQSQGNFQLWKSDGNPGDSVINFGGPSFNINLINGIFVPICNPSGPTTCSSSDMMLRANFTSAAHSVISVSGYFSAPEITPLECTTVSDNRTVNPGSTFSFTSGSCPAGYSMSGGGYNYTVNISNVEVWQASPDGSQFRCRGINGAGNPQPENVICSARCCRVPGI